MQNTSGIWFRRAKGAGDDGRKLHPREESGQEVSDRGVEVARADASPDVSFLEVRHQLLEAGLWFLGFHGFALDGADGGHGGFLGRRGEGVDVCEDVGCAGDGEGGSVWWEREGEEG